MSRLSLACGYLSAGSPGYPERMRARLGAEAPETLVHLGSPEVLSHPLLAFFCAVRLPPRLALAGLDAARCLRDAGVAVGGGFQSPVEREALSLLLRGSAPVLVSPTRGLERARIPGAWRGPLAEGRLLLLSRFPGHHRPPTGAMAEARNRLVAALAERVLVVHAQRGGRAYRLAAEALLRGHSVLTLDDPANADLLLLGAHPLDSATLSSLPPAGAPR